MLAILPTFSGAFPRCGLCIANNGVANCRDLVAAPCIRILNYGARTCGTFLWVDAAKQLTLPRWPYLPNSKENDVTVSTALLCSQRIFI